MACKANGAISIFKRSGLTVDSGNPLIETRLEEGEKSYTGHNIGFIETVDG